MHGLGHLDWQKAAAGVRVNTRDAGPGLHTRLGGFAHAQLQPMTVGFKQDGKLLPLWRQVITFLAVASGAE